MSEKLAGLTPKHEVRTGPAENMGAEGHRLYMYRVPGTLHTTYRKNNNLETFAGMGLNGFQIK